MVKYEKKFHTTKGLYNQKKMINMHEQNIINKSMTHNNIWLQPNRSEWQKLVNVEVFAK